MIDEARQAQLHEAVAAHKLKVDGARSDRPLLVVGVLLMVVGVVGTFVEYQASLSRGDLRDIMSAQLLAIGFLALAVVGAALYVAASTARLLRVWLLRQLLDGQSRTERLVAALDSAQ
jgi:hypothetical protein